MSSFERTAGFSLLEVLVVLAILSMSVVVFATSRIGPSPAMQLEKRISGISTQIAEARTRAIRDQQSQIVEVAGPFCDDGPDQIMFFPDGTAQDIAICLQEGGSAAWLQIDPLTGHVSPGMAR